MRSHGTLLRLGGGKVLCECVGQGREGVGGGGGFAADFGDSRALLQF